MSITATTSINNQITEQQLQLIRVILLHKIKNPPKFKKIILASVKNKFNITKRLHMRYENNDYIHENLKDIVIYKMPLLYKKIYSNDILCEEYEQQYSYGFIDGLNDYIFVMKSYELNESGSFGPQFSRGYVSLNNQIFPIFETPYISHVYPIGITPVFYTVLKYLDNISINPQTTSDIEINKTLFKGYTNIDINMRISLDNYKNNSCRYWNDTKKIHLYYFSLSKKDQRFIVPNYESDEDEAYENFYNSDNDSD